MLQKLSTLLPLYIVLASIVVIFALVSYFLTKKYNPKHMRFYAFFLDVRMRQILVTACAVLNFVFAAYFAVRITEYGTLVTSLILVTTAISFVSAFSIGVMFLDILSGAIMVVALKLSNLVYTYFMTFQDERNVWWLWILLTALIIAFAAFILFRKIEILTKKNKFVRRNANG